MIHKLKYIVICLVLTWPVVCTTEFKILFWIIKP